MLLYVLISNVEKLPNDTYINKSNIEDSTCIYKLFVIFLKYINRMGPLEGKIPQHKKLYDILRTAILDGIYTDGSLLPSENELCSLHSVTRPTVRQALTSLVNDGYIIKHQGKGSIVRRKRKGIGILSMEGTTAAFGDKNVETKVIVKPKVIPWPEHIDPEMKSKYEHFGCIYIERVRIVDRNPELYEKTYIPNIDLPRFSNRFFDNKSLFDVLRRDYNIEIKGGEQKIRSILTDAKRAKYLQIEEGRPIIYLRRKLSTNKQNYFFYSYIYCNTDDNYLTSIF